MKVLFVDDDAMNRRVVRDMMRVAGIAMDEAGDGQTGLDLIDREDYSLVLMDLRMPEMDGMTAIRHIRARPDAKSRTPVVVVTADTSADLRERCMTEGADELLMKPVAMKPLFRLMGSLIAQRARASA